MTMTTGNVNAIAAKGSVPRRLTKNVSTTLNAIIARMPTSIGAESLTSVAPMGPDVSFAEFTCAHMRPILRHRRAKHNHRRQGGYCGKG